MTAPLPSHAEEFLRRFRAALASLPAAEREDLVQEVRGHLAERPPAGPAELSAAFGAPEAYAAGFVSAHALSGALARGTSLALGQALLTGARDLLPRLLLVAPLLLLQLLGLLLAVVGALKPLLPGQVGLFVEPSGRFRGLGLLLGTAGCRELLGWWAVPAFLGSGLLLAWLSNLALRALARRRLARPTLAPSP